MFGHVLSCSDKTSLLLFMLKDAQRRRYGSIECFFLMNGFEMKSKPLENDPQTSTTA